MLKTMYNSVGNRNYVQTPLHVKFRRWFRNYVLSLLSKAFSLETNSEKLEVSSIKNILIIRPNYRIGNTIFLTPLIEELMFNLPNAKIDLFVGNKLAGEILEGMPNISRTIDFRRKILLNPLKLFKYVKEVRKVKYDLAINISGGSISSQIVTALVYAKYKAGFETGKNFLPQTHLIKYDNLYTHSGSKSLEFLKVFKDVRLPYSNKELNIMLSYEEKNKAKFILDELLRNNNIETSKKSVAIFRDARFNKKIPDDWWRELIKSLHKLDENLVFIDILSPDIPNKLDADILEYSNKNLRKLGAFFQACSMYISADTGPLHIASASKAKTVGLFNKTASKKYGLLGENDLSIDINSKTPEDVAKECYLNILS